MAPNFGPVNRRALRKYAEFWRALQLVGAALIEAEKLAAKAVDNPPVAGADQSGQWAAPTPEELKAAAVKAGHAWHVIAGSARKWEAELVSREWRK